MNKLLLTAAVLFTALAVKAEEVPIVGNVESKCVINTDVTGVYGNPSIDKLSTNSADGGVSPIIRYDVAIADTYIARIITPTNFSQSPVLNDTLSWSGSVATSRVSDAGMSAYDAAKVVYDATTEFDLSIAGTTWFKADSSVTYGYGKALPGGNYRAIVQAECIAK